MDDMNIAEGSVLGIKIPRPTKGETCATPRYNWRTRTWCKKILTTKIMEQDKNNKDGSNKNYDFVRGNDELNREASPSPSSSKLLDSQGRDMELLCPPFRAPKNNNPSNEITSKNPVLRSSKDKINEMGVELENSEVNPKLFGIDGIQKYHQNVILDQFQPDPQKNAKDKLLEDQQKVCKDILQKESVNVVNCSMQEDPKFVSKVERKKDLEIGDDNELQEDSAILSEDEKDQENLDKEELQGGPKSSGNDELVEAQEILVKDKFHELPNSPGNDEVVEEQEILVKDEFQELRDSLGTDELVEDQDFFAKNDFQEDRAKQCEMESSKPLPSPSFGSQTVAPALHCCGLNSSTGNDELVEEHKFSSKNEYQEVPNSLGNYECAEGREFSPKDELQEDLAKQCDKECSEVLPYLFVGSRTVAQNLSALHCCGITHILNCVGFSCIELFPDDFTYRTLWLDDKPGEDLTCVLYDVFDFIEEVCSKKNCKILLHCRQGVSRSVALVIAYIMWKKCLCFEEAYEVVKSARCVASPNFSFVLQLMHWQSKILSAPIEKVVSLYRVSPQSAYAPLHLVLKGVSSPSYMNLDSRGVFVIQIGRTIYLWRGKKCDLLMVSAADRCAFQLVRYEHAKGSLVSCNEGSEPSELCDALALTSEIKLKEKSLAEYDSDYGMFNNTKHGGFMPPLLGSGLTVSLPYKVEDSLWLRRK